VGWRACWLGPGEGHVAVKYWVLVTEKRKFSSLHIWLLQGNRGMTFVNCLLLWGECAGEGGQLTCPISLCTQ